MSQEQLPPQPSTETTTVTEKQIVEVLTRFRNILGVMREVVTMKKGFFNPQCNFYSQSDTTGAVLDAYVTQLQSEDSRAHSGLMEDDKEQLLALLTDPCNRAILLAYYAVKAETPWSQTESNIASIQSFKNSGDFPNQRDRDRLLTSLRS